MFNNILYGNNVTEYKANRFLDNTSYNFFKDDRQLIIECISSEQVYKNPKAYNKESYICYIPELTSKIYSREDIISIAKDRVWLADFIFEIITWQHPTTFLDELKNNPNILANRYDEVFNDNK